MSFTKSIEQLENDIWVEPKEFPSGLLERCFKYRKIPINALKIEELRTLISQNIGSKYLLPLVLTILENNPMAEGDLYEGDLLKSTLKIESSIWTNNQDILKLFSGLIIKNELLISDKLGDQTLTNLKELIKT